MRKLVVTPLVSALLGGGVVAAVLLGTGVVDSGNTTTIYEQSPLATTSQATGGSRSGSSGGDGDARALTARDIYKRDAPGVAL